MSEDKPIREDEEFTPIDAGKRTLKIGKDKPIRISSGHRILHHDGKCSRPHGHNYEITVSITGRLTEDEGWVVDKGIITSIIDEWDHRFLVEDGDPLIEAFRQSDDEDALVILPQPPTAEIMSGLLERKIQDQTPENITKVEVEVSETDELCAGCTY